MSNAAEKQSKSYDFDLSQIFVGREEQLANFQDKLKNWRPPQTTPESHADTEPSPNNPITGLVVMLYGRGGFGKSTLLKRFHEIAHTEGLRCTASKIIDWEVVCSDIGRRALFNPPAGEEVNPREYFNLLRDQLALALDKSPVDFKEYSQAALAVERAEKKVRGAVDNLQKDDKYKWLTGAAFDGLLMLVKQNVPGSQLVLNGKLSEQAKKVFGSGVEVGARELAQLRARLEDKYKTELGDCLNAATRLGYGLGRDLMRFAKDKRPLLIFFDTYEEADEADRLLRIVMGSAGAQVGWVMAGRDNLWAGGGQVHRSTALEYGYKDITIAGRRLNIDFDTGGEGDFTLAEIIKYWSMMLAKLPHQPALPMISEEEARQIERVTQGVPLAVKIAAGLYLEMPDVRLLTEKGEANRQIVDQMVRRYLLHTRIEPTEKAKLYGLAMVRRGDYPLVLAEALGLTPAEAEAGFEAELSRLHRRYSFIFTVKDQPLMHQDVRHFLRLWLLENRRSPEVLAVIRRLRQSCYQALEELEKRRSYESLKARLEDDEWTAIYLDLTETQFWLDPDEGVAYALPFMLAAAIYRRNANEDVVEFGSFFKPALSQRTSRDYWQAAASLAKTSSRNPEPAEFSGLEELAKLVIQRCPSFPTLLGDYRPELEAALWWRLGEAQHGKDDNKALIWYEQALKRLGSEAELKEATARAAWNIAYKLSEAKKQVEQLPFLNRAIELKLDYGAAYNSRGIVYYDLKEYPQAIADYSRAIELDPNFALAYNNRGNAYSDRKDYSQAIADYDHAIELDPNLAMAYNNRGLAHSDRKDYSQAFADYNRAIELDPNFVAAYNNRGNAYFDRKDYPQAIADYSRAIELDPNDAYAFNGRGNVYKNLKDYPQAFADYNRAIELDPNFAKAFNNRGNAYSDRKDYPQAIADYNRAIELDPNFAKAFNGRGNAFFALRDYTQAVTNYNCAIELDPNFALAYNNRGNAYSDRKDYPQAITDYDRAIELEPNFAAAFGRRAFTHLKLKNTKQAQIDYEGAWKLNESNINAAWMAQWALICRERANLVTVERLKKIAAINPKNYVAFVCRGVALGLQLKLKEALSEIETAIPLDPEEWDAYFWQGMILTYLRRNDEAKAAIEKALVVELPPVLLLPLSWLKQDRPAFYREYVSPLLRLHDLLDMPEEA